MAAKRASASAAPAPPADDARELDEIADQLYALRPDAFAAERDAQIRQARGAGRQPLARDLGQLRRPTQSAWLINLLWRNERDRMDQFLQLAEELRRAQADASRADLQRLTVRRRELEAALGRGARALAELAGVTVSATLEREVQETLAAGLARPDVADEIRTGRLVKPAAYAGFGTELPAPAVVPPGAANQGPAPAAIRAPKTDDSEVQAPERSRQPLADDPEAQAAERSRQQHADAEQRVAEARAALEVAAEAVADRTRAAEVADQHRQAMHVQVDQVQAQLRDLQEQLRELRMAVAAAEQAVLTAAGRRDQAEKAQAAARRALAQAEQHLAAEE